MDRDICIACANCYTIDPVHYGSDPEGKSKVVGGKSNGRSTGNFDDSTIADAQAAEGSCPVGAIRVTET